MPEKLLMMLAFDGHICAGADESGFEKYYEETLRPFIIALNRNPKIPYALHLSGALLERLEQKKTECFLLIKEMVSRKQIEMIGGGFYEPLLPLLPHNDCVSQIEMLTTYLRKSFGRKPLGCKLFCNAWEQFLTGFLAACGMNFTFLSEEQFALCGETPRPVLTEDQGKLITVFPVVSSLAGMAKGPVLPFLKAWCDGHRGGGFVPEGIVVFPQVNPPMDRFFGELSALVSAKSGDITLELSLPSKIYRASRELPKIYFPNSADPPLSQSRAFLAKHNEANGIYAKLFFVNSLINQLRGDKARKKAAREELMKAEIGEAFCQNGHDDSAELIRYAYKALLNAEHITREKKFTPSLLVFDFDFDHESEYLFQDKNVNAYIRRRGASLFEFDDLPRGINFLGGCGQPSFADRFFSGGFAPSAVSFWHSSEAERNCADESFEAAQLDRQKLKASFVLAPQKQLLPDSLGLKKNYALEKNVLAVSYEITNPGESRTLFGFGAQCNFAFGPSGRILVFKKTDNEEEKNEHAETGEKRRVLSLEMRDIKSGSGLKLETENPCDLYYGWSSSHCLCLLPFFQLSLNAGESWKNRFTLSIISTRRKSP
ncbi:MAG: DUF1926 domain-containing protein [Treponema sp.]|jgi:hypothetical protein|nr:DUF1926 domain-containing protein [Treponema sp.]